MQVFETSSIQETDRKKHILDVIEFPNFSKAEHAAETDGFAPNGYRVEVVAPDDYRVKAAIEMEIEVMSHLGDPPEEVREEFEPYNDSSIFFLAFQREDEGSEDEIAAMGRVVPYKDADHPNKSLTDLAIIPGWTTDDIPTTEGLDVASKQVTIHDTRKVIEAFCEEADCGDMSKVWDIATMAPNPDFVVNRKMKPGKPGMSILAAASIQGIIACQDDQLTHVTSFNQETAHQFFLNLGYPFKKMFGLGPIMYDSFGSGEGMIAQPAWFDVREFSRQVAGAEPGTYMGEIGQILKQRGVL
jgi:hypothetical protein